MPDEPCRCSKIGGSFAPIANALHGIDRGLGLVVQCELIRRDYAHDANDRENRSVEVAWLVLVTEVEDCALNPAIRAMPSKRER